MNRRTSSVGRRAIVVMLMCSLMLIGCSRTLTYKGDVTVYVGVPLSGWQADGGQTVLGGVRLMAEKLNASGGLLGYRVKVVGLDDEADSDVAALVAEHVEKAIEQGEQVIAVVGHYNSGQTLTAMETYKDLPLVVVTATATDVSITQKGYRNFFRVNATDAAQGPAVARFLVDRLGAKRIALVYADNEYGRGLRDQVDQALKSMGTAPLVQVEIPEGAPTQVRAVEQVQAAQPDAVFLAGYETEGYVLLPELREAGVTAAFMASDGCFLYEFIDGAGPAAEGAYVSGVTPDPKVVIDAEWRGEYQEIEARNPGTYSIAGYSAMQVVAEGARQAGTLDAARLADAIHSLDFQSLTGRIHFDSAGDLTEQNVYVFQVRGGDFVQVTEQ